MADSEGTFGGDGSVFWRVAAKNVRSETFKCDIKDGVSLQEGHNGTSKRASFTIAITAPTKENERKKLAAKLRDAAKRLNSKAKYVRFNLPIEPGRHGQISVSWQSAREDFRPTHPETGPRA